MGWSDWAPQLDLTTIADAPVGTIAMKWGHSNIDHLSVSRVDIQMWEVDADALVHFLRGASGLDDSVRVHGSDGNSIAVLDIPLCNLMECATNMRHSDQVASILRRNPVYASRLLRQKVAPAHVGTVDEPAP